MTIGGKAIAAGGYGCVFNPALECLDFNYVKKRYNGISKLLLNSNANEEWIEANMIKNVIKDIPNHDKYVLLPVTMCKPHTFSDSDLIDFDKKCGSFKNAIKEKQKYKILNMPFGGPDLHKYIDSHEVDDNFVYINNSLIELIHFINEYNKKTLIHADIKAPNILIDEQSLKCKIIDWGLALIHDNLEGKDEMEIHEEIEWRPIQFNVPPSNILFSEYFIKEIKKNTNIINPNIFDDKINKYFKEYGNGHLSHMIYMFKVLINNLNTRKGEKITKNEKEVIYDYIRNTILENSTDEGFQYKKYLKNIYNYNCDIWGILTCYFKYLELTRTRFKFKDQKDDTISSFRIKLSELLYKYFTTTSKINITNLVDELKELNNFFNIPKEKSPMYSSAKLKQHKHSKVELAEIIAPSNKVLSKRMKSIKNSESKKRKRCPKGTRRNKKTGECQKISEIIHSRERNSYTKRKRCPNGTRRNKKTGNCEKK